MTRKIIAWITTIALFTNLFGFVALAETDDTPLSLGNDVITFSVDKEGAYQIRTTEEGNPSRPQDGNKTLMFFKKDIQTSFTTFRIDGEDYIFGQTYAYSLSKNARITGASRVEENSIVTDYRIDTGLTVTQTLTFIEEETDTNYGNVYIQYELTNQTGREVLAGARILQDIMLGDNDGVAVKVGDSFYDKETYFEGDAVPDVWRATDNEFGPNLVGYGYTNGWGNIKPDKMLVAHWQGISQTPYQYSVDTSRNFTMESDYGAKDTAVAYYWNERNLADQSSVFFETYYGIGQIVDNPQTYAVNTLAPTQLAVNSDGTGYADDGSFEIAVMLENNLAESIEVYDIMAYLTFEDGDGSLTLDGDASLKGVKLMKKNGQYTFRWNMKAVPGEEFQALRYKVDLYDSRHLYKQGDVLEGNKKVGDVKMDEIYSVSKTLILPNVGGQAPMLGFTDITPEEIYYSGKNLVSIKTMGTDLLVDTLNWHLEYSVNGGNYQSVDRENINIVRETDTMEIMLEETLDKGQMELRIVVDKDIYTAGTEEQNIIEGDIISIPGYVTVSGDKAVMQRSYGMLALVQETGGYTVPLPVAGEDQLSELKSAIEAANASDGGSRQITLKIAGDIRAIRENGELEKYVVYAQHKKAMINDLITYTSAVPMTISYQKGSSSRQTMDCSLGAADGLSTAFRQELGQTQILSQMFPAGEEAPSMASDATFDFPLANLDTSINNTVNMIKNGLGANSGDVISFNSGTSDKGQVIVTGLGVLAINTLGGIDFWMDKYSVRFEDDVEYGLWEAENPVAIDLEGIGSVLNKVLEGMPVQLNGLRLVQDQINQKDMLTFDATVDLTMIPGDVIVDAEDIFFSAGGYEGMRINSSIAPEKGIGIVQDINMDVLIDTYRNLYQLEGGAKIGVVQGEIEFTLMKERRNNTWHLSTLILSGGGRPGIPVSPGVLYLTKLGGGVRNLDQLTNPYYDKPAQPFTVVIIAGLNVVNTIDGEFTGQITEKEMSITAPEAELMKLDILRDLGTEVIWMSESGAAFQINAYGSLDLMGVIMGDMRITISDVFFEGASNARIVIPGSVPLVGGKTLAETSFGVSSEKIWGALKLKLLFIRVSVGATYWWRGKFEFNVGEAGPLLDGPDAGLYYGEFLDQNGDTIEYVVGTNVEAVGGVGDSLLTSMQPFRVYMTGDGLSSGQALAESQTAYTHVDEAVSLDGKHIYGLALSTTEETNLALRHAEGENAGGAVDIYKLVSGTETVENAADTLASVEHVIGTDTYTTFIGFGESEAADYVISSDAMLQSYFTYTDQADYTDDELSPDISGYQNLYELHLDTRTHSQLALTHSGNLDISVYRLNDQGVLKTAPGVTVHREAAFNGQNLILIDGFEEGIEDAVYYISSDKTLELQNILESRSVVVPESTSQYGSTMVAEFVSEDDIENARVFYITDSDGAVLSCFQWQSDDAEQADYQDVFGQTEIEGESYHTMLCPFDQAGTYNVHSSLEISEAHTAIYEIEDMPTLDADSVSVSENAASSSKKDISWQGGNYRYTGNELKNTERTMFSFYLSDETIPLLESGEFDYDPGVYLGRYEPDQGDDDAFTVDIPKSLPSGSYRVMVVMKTEGLSQEYAYSQPFDLVNPLSPQAVASVTASDHGNGFISASWQPSQEAESYYLEVFDENRNMNMAFGSVVVDGADSSAIIGGVFESFDPENPEEGQTIGLETGKDYRVGITPVKKIDEQTTMTGQTTYSNIFRLDEPSPAVIEIGLSQGQFTEFTQSVWGIDADGNSGSENVTAQGTNSKSPAFEVTLDEPARLDFNLDGQNLQTGSDYVTQATLQLDALTEGMHCLDVVARNQRGDISYETCSFMVDSRAPELLVDTPEAGEVIGETDDSISVKGRTEAGSALSINGKPYQVGEGGLFEAQVAADTNLHKLELEIEASDSFGNSTLSRIQLQRKTSPIDGFTLESDIPKLVRTYSAPIYEVETESVVNPFTGQIVSVPIAESDTPTGYEDRTMTENVVSMGSSYQLTPMATIEGSDTTLPIDSGRVDYSIEQGASIAEIDSTGRLTINNNGMVVVKAEYQMTEDYSLDQYISMNSEFADVYAQAVVQEPVTHVDDRDDRTPVQVVEELEGEVTLQDGSGNILAGIEATDELDSEGLLHRKVLVGKDQAESGLGQLSQGAQEIMLDMSDVMNDADVINISVPENAVESFVKSGAGLTIKSTQFSINLPPPLLEKLDTSGKGLDLSFKFAKEEKEDQVKENFKENETGGKILSASNVSWEGKTRIIEGNIPKAKAIMTLPLEMDRLPAAGPERNMYLRSLAIFIDHGQGDEETKPVRVVEIDDKGNLGVVFCIDRMSSFSIISVESWKDDQIDEYNSYISGYPDGSVGADKPITRAEAATVISRLSQRSGQESQMALSDLEGHWADAYITDAQTKGLMNGYPDKTFRPDNMISRAELASIVYNWIGAEEGPAHSFKDISSHWAENKIAAAAAMGYLSGYPDKTFRPDNKATRAEFISIMNRLSGRVHALENLEYGTWNDVAENHWAFQEIEKASRYYRIVKAGDQSITIY